MKSSLQIKWYGIIKFSSKTTNKAKLPKSLLKGTFGVFHMGGVILTTSKIDASKIKANAKGRRDLISFVITDRQFGMINIQYNRESALAKPFKHGLFVKDGIKNIAIPVTLKQMQNDWISPYSKSI